MHTTTTTSQFHGSDIEAVAAHFGVDKNKMISFAANVNPLGISPLLKTTLASQLDVISRYPERDYQTLRTAIGNYIHIQPEHIIVGNGSTELISGVIKTICPKEAILVAPSYSEYERDVSLCGGSIRLFSLNKNDNFTLQPDALIRSFSKDTRLLILCNPNNPTASAVKSDCLRAILSACKERSIFVMIDETYIEFSEHMEEIEAIPLTSEYDNLIVLRGVSKFFAAPGLRLGYGISSNLNLLQSINEHKDPWAINSLAEKAGQIMFSDQEYIQKTKTLITAEKEKMIHILSQLQQVKVYPSESNFILVEFLSDSINSSACFAYLAKRGFMVRDCSSFSSLKDRFIRICMMLPEDNARMLQALCTYLS